MRHMLVLSSDPVALITPVFCHQGMWGSTVKKTWMSVPQIPASMMASAMNDPTTATMESLWTFQLTSATKMLLDSSASASQALMVSAVVPWRECFAFSPRHSYRDT